MWSLLHCFGSGVIICIVYFADVCMNLICFCADITQYWLSFSETWEDKEDDSTSLEGFEKMQF